MTTLHSREGRTWAYVKGAPAELLAGCTHLGDRELDGRTRQEVVVPLLRTVFTTAPLSIMDRTLVTASGVLVLVADEIRKFLPRRK